MTHKITQAGPLVRATVWTEHGTSTKTFNTAMEARSWSIIAENRKPVRRDA